MKWIDIDGEKVAVSKGIVGGWRVVHPMKNEDGTRNWANTLYGGTGNLIFLLAMITIVAGMLYLFQYQLELVEQHYYKIAQDPIGWCKDVNAGRTNPFEYYNGSGLNLTIVK